MALILPNQPVLDPYQLNQDDILLYNHLDLLMQIIQYQICLLTLITHLIM